MQRGRANTPLFWAVLGVVVIADVITKAIAVYSLVPQRIPHELFGDTVRFTLVYNPGAAFGLHLGAYSRWIFMVLTIGALFILGRLYRSTKDGDLLRTLAISLVCAGAIGNLIDRIRSAQGVVDFIDVGIGDARWPTFNVADMAVSIGAFLLAWVLWGEDTTNEREAVVEGDGESPPAVSSMSASPAPSAGQDM
ncbi:MAG TPA: signal peptidase II [Gemmatimonadaceae bacterium]|nr:signal peptidase II [Gemmatimonadaceae bacterium]